MRIFIFWLNLGKKPIYANQWNIILLGGLHLIYITSYKLSLRKYIAEILFYIQETWKNWIFWILGVGLENASFLGPH